MTTNLTLTTSDNHSLGAYRADPEGQPKGAIVIIQEIFGVNGYIRSVCDRYAARGYTTIAPALFDRIETGVELDYSPDSVQAGLKMKNAIPPEQSLADIAACIENISDAGPVTVIGFCWGGSLAWLAACRLDGLSKAVAYYGGQVAEYSGETPKVPVLLHFGDQDASIPMDAVEKVKAAHPDIPLYIYEAGHGFSCDQRASYDAPSAALALERTLDFLAG